MNISRKLLYAAGLLGLLCLLLPGPVRANTIYTYTSQDMHDGPAFYGSFSLTLEFANPLPASLDGTVDQASNVLSWSFSFPGNNTLNLGSGSGNYLANAYLATDATGTIVSPWAVTGCTTQAGCYTSGVVFTAFYDGDTVQDYEPVVDTVYYGDSSKSPSYGYWSAPVSTPEPGTLSLLFVGLLGLGLLAGVKSYRGNRLQTQE